MQKPQKNKRRGGEKEVKREKNFRKELGGEGTFASDSFSWCGILLFKSGFSYPATIKVKVPRLHHTKDPHSGLNFLLHSPHVSGVPWRMFQLHE